MIEQLKESLIDTDNLGDSKIKDIILNILREIKIQIIKLKILENKV